MVEIISKKCVDILPLSAEPIASWGTNTDLRTLLIEMYELGGYSSYGVYCFEEGMKRWEKTLAEFQENALAAAPAPTAERQAEPIPDFRNDTSLRGKHGLLDSLRNRGVLSPDLSKLGSDMYGDLSSSIHGAETRLVHTGVFEGKWAGLIFRYDRFREWCTYFARCVDFGIHALRLSTNLWQARRPKDRIQCDVCHNDNDFEIDRARCEGLVTFTCRRCGNAMNYDASWVAQLGY
jgi:hypothetical protein